MGTGVGDGASVRRVPSRWPAWLDLAQGLTGLVLVVFMWFHLFFVSSILLGKDAMYAVTRFFEGSLITDTPQPWIVSLVALAIFLLFTAHTVLALRKIPGSYREYRAYLLRMRQMPHEDSLLWLVQVVTGLILMFFVTAHLLELFMHPANIGPYASADKIYAGGWLLGLVLLLSVEVHAGIGLYRLIVKWGWFGLVDTVQRRRRLRMAIYALITFFLVLGLSSQAAYLKIGREHRDQAGERYHPAQQIPGGV